MNIIMDENLKYYLKSLNFEDNDILNMIKTTPALQIIDYDYALENILIVVSKGFPMEDIDSIVAINPTFLAEDHNVLRQKLSTITNIEEELKADPFLI